MAATLVVANGHYHKSTNGDELQAMPFLPIELYRPIVASVDDHHTLYLLLFTCKALSLEAERSLYCAVKGRCDSTSFRFLGTVIRSPRLATKVINYEFLGATKLGSAGLKLLHLGLRALVGLRSLRIEGDRLCDVYPILHRCTFMLESFDCWHHYADGGEMMPFLATQPKLRYLRIKWDAADQPPPPSICPNLAILNGNRGAIEAFLPGRSIKRLFWNAATVGESNEPLSPQVCDALVDLKVLTLAGATLKSCPSFTSFFEYLCNLEVLDLHDDRMIDPYVVASLPRLKSLILCGMFTSCPRIGAKEKCIFLKNLFTKCRNLETVDFRNHTYYERWRPQCLNPIRVTYAQANWWYFE